ncbi:hypothetical protein PRZ48_013173 [Zasmidium cellare]|uniref:Uncharacterized protein n=1 Tax=Zasmidium cellare TaxID=395010 RepID=A0ABR0E3B2_ZASCE|nr:hypothetical protein PRZ48_013173 [Zasmidium cellare]
MTSSKSMGPLTDSFFPAIFRQNQFKAKAPPIPPSTDLKDQVAIVTGANIGLGLECCRQLLGLQLSHLILAVRSTEKGEAAALELRKKYAKAKIEVWILDLESYDSVQAFARRADKELTRLDMAILNAGMMTFKFGLVKGTGHETMVQVNYLSNALLSLLLLPALRKGAKEGRPGRLTIINAALSHVAKPPFLDTTGQKKGMLSSFDNEKAFTSGEWYNSSKVLMHFFVWKLSELVPADEVVVNLVVLGYIKSTGLAREVPMVVRPLMKGFEALTAGSLQDGASTYVDAAVVKGKENHGCCLMSWKVQPYAALLYSKNGHSMVEKLWQETMDEVGAFGVEKKLLYE